MDHKKWDDGENEGCCAKCLGCLMCCNLPASAGVKIVSILSILLGLVYCCLGVWTLIVTTSNDELARKDQLRYEIWTTSTGGDPLEGIYVTNSKKLVYLNEHYNYLISLACISLSVGFIRTLSSIFLLWNSVEKHSTSPGKFWIFLTFLESATIVTFLTVTLNVTGFITDCPILNPFRLYNDKFSFYVLIAIFRFVVFSDIFLSIYFIFIVVWFVRTR